MQALGDDDVASIHQTIDDEVLRRQRDQLPLDRACEADGDTLRVRGDLTLVGNTQPFDVRPRHGDDGAVSATAVVTQTGLRHEALLRALRRAQGHDDVQVVLEGHLEPQSR